MELRKKHTNHSLGRICKLFGITRQAFYQFIRRQKIIKDHELIIIEKVMKIRAIHPRMGVRKIYYIINQELKNNLIKIGRDKLYDILSKYNLLIRNTKRGIRTTFSSHWMRKYNNKIKKIQIYRKNQVWVSDITYYKIGEKFVFISLITDSYSKKILGSSIEESLSKNGPINALKQALENYQEDNLKLIHHSDRGLQYCSNEYIEILESKGIEISMTESGDPRDNAVAERVNGIIKNEYMSCIKIGNIKKARKALKRSIEAYNQSRPHLSCGLLTPMQMHQGNIKSKILWKSYYKTYKYNITENY